jgi:NitT/TauT family transport system permease protein
MDPLVSAAVQRVVGRARARRLNQRAIGEAARLGTSVRSTFGPTVSTERALWGGLRSTLAATWPRLLSVFLLGATWYLISFVVSTDVVPTPLMTLDAFRRSLDDGYVWSDVTITLGRIVAAFGLAMLIGIAYGSALGTLDWFRRIFDIWLTIAASIPGLLYLVIAYLWLGLNDLAAVLGAALVVAPSVTFNVWQGMKSLDPGLSEMARAFDVPQLTIFRRVTLPQTLPFIFASARLGLALTWKIVMFVELLGRSSGVGYRIEHWYQLFNMSRVLASALLLVAIMLVVEIVVLGNLERFLFRWRREETR